nr:immunoglobulin light chain junction region [Macaca mulatta]MOX26120.1 immunoglobulin light chain junction region [Macaca mulatta]
CQQVYKVPFTF